MRAMKKFECFGFGFVNVVVNACSTFHSVRDALSNIYLYIMHLQFPVSFAQVRYLFYC